MKKIVECVPNFSEGKDKSIINAISAAIESVEGVKLLDVDPGADFNRTVYTFVGEPEPILEAAFQAAKVGVALIDMTKQKGEHARMGALDVCPFIPIKGTTGDDCIKLSKQFGERMAKELGVPVFLYAKSATKPERVRLPDIRKGEYEALEEKLKDLSFKPDFGKPEFIPKSGATATGAREILIAYNVNLDTNDKSIASTISGKIRSSGVIKKDKDGNIRIRLEEVSKTRVKVERIASLANDLALALAASTIKIEAPVPGKSMVGIEVPNSITELVSLRSVIESTAFHKLKSRTKLPLALGKGVSGEPVVADLAKMPHLLIAGATGSLSEADDGSGGIERRAFRCVNGGGIDAHHGTPELQNSQIELGKAPRVIVRVRGN